MAALNRPTNATYAVHENITVDTLDNEDHTFCGIMFPIKCKDLLPVDHLVLKSVAVRGHLGPLTVWVSNVDGYQYGNRRLSGRSSGNVLRRHGEDQEILPNDHRISLHPSSWTKLYEKTHKPCPRGQYTELVFDKPVRLKPGEMRALYIHSTLSGDQAIVYDNSYHGSSVRRYDDDKLSILTGRAHVSTTCFGQDPIWGWGNAWRDRREFVGRLAYGTVYKLWNPEVLPKFGSCFQNGARSLLMCQRRWESPISVLPDEAIFYILNMCPWDWFNDCTKTMKDRRKREKARSKLLLAQEQRDQEQKIAATSTATFSMEEDDEDAKPSANDVVCARSSRDESLEATSVAQDGKTIGLEDSDEDGDESVDMEDSDEEDCVEDDDDMAGDEEKNTDSDDDVSFSDDSSEEDDDHYHNANRRHFSFHYPDSDDEDNDDSEQSDSRTPRSHWIRHQIARVHVLRALASMEGQALEDHSLFGN